MKKKDINIKIEDYILNCRAVAIIVNNDNILFQKRRQDEFWALPGGKIRVGETTKETVTRELKEELALNSFDVSDVSTVSEYFFEFGIDKYHQFIFGHKVLIKDDEWILKDNEFDGIEKDGNLIFKWFKMSELDKAPIKPDFLKEQLENINKKELQFVTYKEEK